jgi:maltooligosyltrehalose trehalohydrolase
MLEEGMIQPKTLLQRRLPIGAECIGPQKVHFRVWAPSHHKVCVVLEGGPGSDGSVIQELDRERAGYYSTTLLGADHGTLYRYQLDDSIELVPDPASRYQPDGPFGPSQVVDSLRYRWLDHKWPGTQMKHQLLYEMHIGTYTKEGTWANAETHLKDLANLGVTVIEMMPIAEFPGRFGWGYDGADLYAPTRLYGYPDNLRHFIDTAHELGLAVILDVVYNHFGTVGNFLGRFSEFYVSKKHKTDWGDAINYDGEHSDPVREFITTNAAYWISEYHFDGLRLDATQNYYDTSPENIITSIITKARQAAQGRSIIILAENEPQQSRLLKPIDKGGNDCDAVWNDDFHHSALVAATGRNEAYYREYCGTPQELLSSLKHGYLYQGQYHYWQQKQRGSASLWVKPHRYVHYIQNHDQISNSAYGIRLHHITSPGRYRALTALLLLAPQTPLLFQGQEFAASTPFTFFADLPDETAQLMRAGRRKFLGQFPSLAQTYMEDYFPNPCSINTFEQCILDHREQKKHEKEYAMIRDLIRLRQEDPVISMQSPVDGAVLGESCFLFRYFGTEQDDRLVIVNLGINQALTPAPEPLLAPPQENRWELLWFSEHPAYGGAGALSPVDEAGRWQLAGEAAAVVKAVPIHEG